MNVNCKIFQECSSNYSPLYFVGLSPICCCTFHIQVFSIHSEKYGLPSICQVSCLFPFLFVIFHDSLTLINYIRWPGVVDFDDPHGSCDLPNTKNLYIDVNKDIKVGVWHILPSSYDLQTGSDHDHEGLIRDDGKTVILYLHGNSANRAGAHRVELYKVNRESRCTLLHS